MKRGLTPDEVRAYLARWIMEFGTGPVTWDERADNPWYENELECGTSVDDPVVRRFITHTYEGDGCAQITEAGLQFLKGDEDDSP